ncbi:MAG TPA: pseudouridine synthase [Chitinophagaceae bacterium]|nr:pseudouridine synthase [Chitinophagaceae bacterium]
MSKHAFEKFIKPEPTGARKKEMIRQEKRKLKKEAREAGEAFRQKKREANYNTSPLPVKRNGKSNVTENTAHKKAGFGTQRNVNSNTRQQNKKQYATTAHTGSAINITKKIQPKAGKVSNTVKPLQAPVTNNDLMPLNKFVAHAGVCARREAAEMVKQGKVSVNGVVVYEPGFKVAATDKIKAAGKLLVLQHNLVYVLLNKPKDYITTAKDPEGRKTVFDLVKNATKERIYPVGRLDRNTTGVLLLTNDGELAQKLTHPSFEVKKVYEVKLDKPLVKKDFDAILTGITLEDGFVVADSLAYADAKDKTIVGIEIHSGRNRIVRRLFEHLGYDVKGLDRVMFANLTKKNVDRGKCRLLNEKEIRLLKYLNQGFVRKNKQAGSNETAG